MTQNPEASFPNQVFPALEMKSKVKVKDHEGGEDAMMDITNGTEYKFHSFGISWLIPPCIR